MTAGKKKSVEEVLASVLVRTPASVLHIPGQAEAVPTMVLTAQQLLQIQSAIQLPL